MNPQQMPRRLIVNADDFGRSATINEAVVRAHREGILTTASLMVNEPGCAEAVALARAHPRLGVGLHLTLLCGKSGLDPARIPLLVGKNGDFTNNPVAAGMRYNFTPGIRAQLRQEIHEQFARFRATGLTLDHVNGHLHMHLHPAVFSILRQDATELGIQRMRLTRDPLALNLAIAKGRLAYRLSHALIFGALSAWAGGTLRARGIRHTRRVFGLLQNAIVDEPFILALLDRLPGGDSELYSHPCVKDFKAEFEALISPAVVRKVRDRGVELIRYQDL